MRNVRSYTRLHDTDTFIGRPYLMFLNRGSTGVGSCERQSSYEGREEEKWGRERTRKDMQLVAFPRAGATLGSTRKEYGVVKPASSRTVRSQESSSLSHAYVIGRTLTIPIEDKAPATPIKRVVTEIESPTTRNREIPQIGDSQPQHRSSPPMGVASAFLFDWGR
ncbi:hypothetical protein CRG98_024859 [Punica granatum]|uniref:Uncharacterized protein n=1 Tax=Punica granatum TaxID=22663 RepID=A0A2I0JEU7_PUNGR|nr:hypothetical protein CRG98_024859 [Punica granatum]